MNYTHTTPVKVVRILCTKIIITNDKRDKAQNLMDFIKGHHVFFECSDAYPLVININADDEKLYEICCGISEYIMFTDIKSDIKRILDREYSCFNNDEKELICSSVFAGSEIAELPGRIYIYLKYSGTINPDGFYRFMCRDIESSVEEAVCEEADRLINLNDTADFIQLLKYFSSLSPVCTERVDIIADKKGIRICDVKGREDSYCAEFASMEPLADDVLSELINLNPVKVIIHGREFYLKNDLSAVISGVFEERISFCGGCPLCGKYE